MMDRRARRPSQGLHGSPRGVLLVVAIGAAAMAAGWLGSLVMTWIMT